MDLKLARQTALQQRPEVKEAEIDTRRADYDRKLAKAQYIPDVGAAIHYFDPINTEILPQNIASAGVELKWDPFDWGGRRDEVKQKDVTVQQSHYQLQETQAAGYARRRQYLPQVRREPVAAGCGPGRRATRPMRNCAK